MRASPGAHAMKPRPSVESVVGQLVDEHPKASEWSAREMAQHLGRNVRSVKESAAFRRVRAERDGVELAAADVRVLAALSALTITGRVVPAGRVARAARRSVGLVRRRLSALAKMGYALSRVGDRGGYQVTDQGTAALRATQPARRGGRSAT